MYRYETHMHTLPVSRCARYNVRENLEFYKSLGYDGIFITNHFLDGKDVTIVGRSNIVGKPLADMMMAEGATVTQCHSHTLDVSSHCIKADIIVSAVGKPKFITKDYIFPGMPVVIDVGINRDENGKLCGDVSDEVQYYATHITPVPGGVGPMTVAELMKNVVQAWKNN
jgi:methylenetetrahydrofolate dehydrogenase (NADP+)/methenyltetrahydrofolate cyclohydrolase